MCAWLECCFTALAGTSAEAVEDPFINDIGLFVCFVCFNLLAVPILCLFSAVILVTYILSHIEFCEMQRQLVNV